MTSEDEFEAQSADEQIQEMDDAQIMFFLNLLQNEYHTSDIARVAIHMHRMFQAQFICQDCEVSVIEKDEFFLVHDQLEQEVGLDEGRLCVECFEARLGRELTAFDFTKSMSLDEDMDHSPLLQKRLISGLLESLPDI